MLPDPQHHARQGHGTEPADERRGRWRRLPPGIFGAIAGEVVWALALLGIFLPLPDVLDIFQSLCVLIAFLVGIGGWLLLWGDNGPLYGRLESTAFHIAFALFFYALVGWCIGRWVACRRARRPSSRDMTGD